MTHSSRRRRYRSRIEIADSTLRPSFGSDSCRITCNFDGACLYPGGPAAYGAIVRRGSRVIWRASGPVPDPGAGTSSNVAEYAKLIAVLRYLLAEGLSDECILIHGDSQLVIRQMFGRWRIKHGCYVRLACEAENLLAQFPYIQGCWTRRENNTAADALAKAALSSSAGGNRSDELLPAVADAADGGTIFHWRTTL
jgi:ribonuclease HI